MSDSRQAKACKKCGEIKELAHFHRASNTADGRTSACKTCRLAAAKIRRTECRETVLDSNKKWRLENPEKFREITKAAYERNKEKIKDRVKIYRRTHKEKVNLYARKGREKLIDSYVMSSLRLKKIDLATAPAGLLDLKRNQIEIHRLAKKLKEAANESSKDTDRISGKHVSGDDAGGPAKNRRE